MAQRLLRANPSGRHPYEVPERDAPEPRLRGVLAVIYLVFTEGYAATSGEARCGLIWRAKRSGWRGCSTG